MAKKAPRFLRGYPQHYAPMLRRRYRGVPGLWPRFIQPRPRIHARNWRYSTRAKLNPEEKAAQGIRGSLEERIFFQALLDHGFIPGVDFDFQSAMMGGRAELGGLVADFLFPLIKLIVNPSSIWHTRTLDAIVRDADQTALLASFGYYQILLDPDIIHDPVMLDDWIQRNLMSMWVAPDPVLE